MLNTSEENHGTLVEDSDQQVVEPIKSISLVLESVDLTPEMTFEIVSFLNTFEMTQLSMLNRDWYEYINGEEVNEDPSTGLKREIKTPCSQLWKQLLRNEFRILYFPFGSDNMKKLKLNEKLKDERRLSQEIVQNYFKFQEITKSEFNIRSDDPTNVFFRVHVKGSSKTGKSKLVSAVCGS